MASLKRVLFFSELPTTKVTGVLVTNYKTILRGDMKMSSIITCEKLQDSATTVQNGRFANINNSDEATVSISGTSTSFTVKFQASLDGVTFFDVEGDKINNSTAPSATSTSTLNEAWQFDTASLIYFRTPITAIGNGNITVIINAVNVD